jgi:ribonuclease P protein component
VLPAEHRLRRRLDFETAIRHGRRAGRPLLVVHLAVRATRTSMPSTTPNATVAEPARAGFTVNRAVGGSVQRHAVVRRLRHLARRHLASLPPGSLLVVRALPGAAEATSQELDTDLDSALKRVLRSGASA